MMKNLTLTALHTGLPPKQGLYDPQNEHDSCGVGFVVNIKGNKSHKIIRDALTILINLNHRGACGCEANTGDGAGILIPTAALLLQARFAAKEKIKLPAQGDYGVAMVFLPLRRQMNAAPAKRCSRISWSRKARDSSAGGLCRRTTKSPVRLPK